MTKTMKDTLHSPAVSIATFALALVVGLLLGGIAMRQYLDREE